MFVSYSKHSSGVVLGKSELSDGLKKLSPADINQVLKDTNIEEMDICETIVTAGFRRLRPEKAKLIVSDCNFDKHIVEKCIKESSRSSRLNKLSFDQSDVFELLNGYYFLKLGFFQRNA